MSVVANRTISVQYRSAEDELELVSKRLVEKDRNLDETFSDIDLLFSDLVGNLELKQIPLDRSTRISLRRGQAIYNRIASCTEDAIGKASARCTLGHIHYHLNDLNAAIAAYSRATDDLPRDTNSFEALLAAAYASNHLVQALATLGFEDEALRRCRQIRTYVDSYPDKRELRNELAFAARNEAILLAVQRKLPTSIESARMHLGIIERLARETPQDVSLVERHIDGMYLLAGLHWKTNQTRKSSIELLRKVHLEASALADSSVQRFQAGESVYEYSRYKAEARRSRRELDLALGEPRWAERGGPSTVLLVAQESLPRSAIYRHRSSTT